jgi:putative NIF3 family GTP cyclohydrolase 1 type 2
MLTSTAVAAYIDELLDTVGTPDYPNALNGLQLENRSPIRGIAAAVDFSTRAVKGAVESGANFLIVHHGMFWGGLTPSAAHRTAFCGR